MSEARSIVMKDGRTVKFGEKQKIDKDYYNEDGLVVCRVDFDNGETVLVKVDPKSEVGLAALGHGLSQKLGDAGAGEDTTDNAYESVLEVAARVAQGQWNKVRGGEGGTIKGASDLLEALCVVLGQSKEQCREALLKLSQADKLALRKTPEVAAQIERIKAARAPSEGDKAKAAAGSNLLAALKGSLPTAAATSDQPQDAAREADAVKTNPEKAPKKK